ncbi:DUF3105 domain-containing protein [Nocardia aurantia]|uniref:DUF3105 domain-containing protein n=1 Tax=Nocardia aurantia TaxID=2585199 RepID=A0A7K0DW97_9NOCA|nr:DUF3105 domain-containing protein [Nocardia aurantia]MQY30046.1 hypothetical protein [Nocardia aurantia]
MPNTSAKSAKAIRAAAKSSPARKAGGGGAKLPNKRQIPWPTIGAAVVIIALIAALAVYLVPMYQKKADAEKFTPTAQKKDPSLQIPGVVTKEYKGALHVSATQRVAYDQSPPFGGPHDASWADCTGKVYGKAIRTENAVHALEHGAVWIAYNPDKVAGGALDELKQQVQGKPYMLMSPYPGLDSAVSLQSWGHQLKLSDPDDKRVGEFISALRLNQYGVYPEVGADCANPTFNVDSPPPFDPTPPGPTAIPMDGKGLSQDQTELSGGAGGGIPGLPGGIPGLPGMPGVPGGVPGQPAAPAPAQPAPAQPAPAQPGSNQ